MSQGQSGMRVFVVDDEKVVADTLATILQKAGFSVWAFNDGQAALEAAFEKPPDFVISDVVMPKLNGLELATALRKQFPACQVLLFSGNAGLHDLIEQKDRNTSFEILMKPVHPSILLQRVSASAQARMAAGGH